MEIEKQPARHVLAAITAEPWAITAEGLEQILAIAERATDATPEALEAYRARSVATAERLQARGNVAVLDVRGSLFRYANIFTEMSGATSYSMLRRDLQAALDDDQFRAIVLNLDTSGGAVTGVAELADAIRAGRTRKPIIAYVGDMAASAGYWLASAATEIVTAETGILGSIGVRMVLRDTTEQDRKSGRVEFISSQSPGKRSDVATDAGRARVQKTLDALADVFIAAVAKGRGVSVKTVAEKFGAGDVLVGAHAVKAGMADRLGSFEAVVAELNRKHAASVAAPAAALSIPAPAKPDHGAMWARVLGIENGTPAAQAQSAQEAAPAPETGNATADEGARVRAILGCPEAKGRPRLAEHIVMHTQLGIDGARAALAAAPIETNAAPAPAPATRPAPVAAWPTEPLAPVTSQDWARRQLDTQGNADRLWKKAIAASAPKGGRLA